MGIWWSLKDNFRQFSIKTCCEYSLESPQQGDSNEYPQHMFLCCGYSLESPQQGDSNEYTQYMFLWRNKQNYPLIITKYPPDLFHCSKAIPRHHLNSVDWDSKHQNWATSWQNQQNVYGPSEDSDQPGHPPSLISHHLRSMQTAKTLIWLGRCPGRSESPLRAQVILLTWPK